MSGSISPLLVPCSICIRKLYMASSRNFWNCLCSAVPSFCQVSGRFNSPTRSRVCNIQTLINCLRKAVYFFTQIQRVCNTLPTQCHAYWPLPWSWPASSQLHCCPYHRRASHIQAAPLYWQQSSFSSPLPVFLKDFLSIHLSTPGMWVTPLSLRHSCDVMKYASSTTQAFPLHQQNWE